MANAHTPGDPGLLCLNPTALNLISLIFIANYGDYVYGRRDLFKLLITNELSGGGAWESNPPNPPSGESQLDLKSRPATRPDSPPLRVRDCSRILQASNPQNDRIPGITWIMKTAKKLYCRSRSLSENWKGSRSWLGRGRCKAARRRRCRCTSSRSANEADAPSKPEPEGRMGVARRSLRCSSSTMCTNIASSSRLALTVQAPCARPLRILGQAPRARVGEYGKEGAGSRLPEKRLLYSSFIRKMETSPPNSAVPPSSWLRWRATTFNQVRVMSREWSCDSPESSDIALTNPLSRPTNSTPSAG